MKHKLPIEHHITLEYLLRQVSILTLQTLLNSAKLYIFTIDFNHYLFAISSEKDFTHTNCHISQSFPTKCHKRHHADRSPMF